MATKLIELTDGSLIEVEVPPDQAQRISGGFADKVDSSLERIRPLLLKVCRPIIDAWEVIGQEISVNGAVVELGLSFEGEGNLYVTRSKAGASITIRLLLGHATDDMT